MRGCLGSGSPFEIGKRYGSSVSSTSPCAGRASHRQKAVLYYLLFPDAGVAQSYQIVRAMS